MMGLLLFLCVFMVAYVIWDAEPPISWGDVACIMGGTLLAFIALMEILA